MVACAAMLFGITYDQALEYFPEKAVQQNGTGWWWEYLYPVMSHWGFHFTIFKKEHWDFTKFDFNEPCILTLPSLNYKDTHHVIYWDGKELYDPSTKKQYKEFPDIELIKEVVRMEKEEL